MTMLEFIPIIRDTLLGGAAIITAVVAVFGLTNWRRELRGKIDFEAARNLIKATYRVRDTLQASRSPFVWAHEFPSDYPGPKDATAEQQAQKWSYVYQNRWAAVAEALKGFEIHVLEAESLWGSDIRVKTDKLKQCAIVLQTAMQAFIDDKAERGENFPADKEFANEVKRDLYARSGDKNNALSNEINSTVDAIEDVAKPHLRRR